MSEAILWFATGVLIIISVGLVIMLFNVLEENKRKYMSYHQNNSNTITQQMEMVQMLQMQFMDMTPVQLMDIFYALKVENMLPSRQIRSSKVISKFMKGNHTQEDIACIATTLALHLAGVEE